MDLTRVEEALKAHHSLTGGSHFSLFTSKEVIYEGNPICHNSVRHDTSLEADDIVVTGIPRSKSFIDTEMRRFIEFVLNEPFFEDFFAVKDAEWVIENRAFVSNVDMPLSHWYVCAMFLRASWQGLKVLGSWNLLMDHYQGVKGFDPFVAWAATIMFRLAAAENKDYFIVNKDIQIINGHFPFPYSCPHDLHLAQKILKQVKKRKSASELNDVLLWESRGLKRYAFSDFFWDGDSAYRDPEYLRFVSPFKILLTKPQVEQEGGLTPKFKELAWSKFVEKIRQERLAEVGSENYFDHHKLLEV
jgi:hypothetical protein